jgi:limonene-1,2-epoxide hydrolase
MLRWSSVVIAMSLLAAVPLNAQTKDEKIATVERMIQAWNAKDWERVYEMFAPDGVLHSMMIQPVVGREAIKARLSALVADIDRIELRVRHIGVIDGVVFVERLDDFEYRGKHGEVPVVGVIEVENGLVKVWREYYDRAQLLRAMGVTEEQDPTAKQ